MYNVPWLNVPCPGCLSDLEQGDEDIVKLLRVPVDQEALLLIGGIADTEVCLAKAAPIRLSTYL